VSTAAATLREIVVLGRHGQQGGRHTGGVAVAVDGVPLLAHTTVLDGADPALCGPAGTGGARAVGTLVCVGAQAPPAARGETPDVRWAWSPLEGPGGVLMAVGTPSAVAAVLDAVDTGAAHDTAAGCPRVSPGSLRRRART
jgi:urease accessory protein